MSPIAYHAHEPPRRDKMVAITRPSGFHPISQNSRIRGDDVKNRGIVSGQRPRTRL